MSKSSLLVGVIASALIAAPPTLPAQVAASGLSDARVARIERSLFAVAATGVDSGSPRTIAQRMAALNVRGMSVAVFDSGRIIWARAYGYRDVAAGALADTGTLFQAASISKPVAATAMLLLVERGTLALDEDVNAKLQSWKVPANRFTQTGKVTPRRIVSHMAGLTVHGFAGYAVDAPLPTLPQILDGAAPANSPPVRVDTFPGARESYSGGGVTVLQLLMQDVTRMRFDTLMHSLILGPLGMRQSTFTQPLPTGLIPRSSTGYDARGSAVAGRYRVHPEQAAAGLWTTPSDLARFMLAIGRSYRGEPDGILRQATAREMLTKIPGGGGLGFGLSGDGDAFRYRHNGGNAGFACYAVAFSALGRGVVVMTNSDVGDKLIRELTRAISREYGWPPLANPP